MQGDDLSGTTAARVGSRYGKLRSTAERCFATEDWMATSDMHESHRHHAGTQLCNLSGLCSIYPAAILETPVPSRGDAQDGVRAGESSGMKPQVGLYGHLVAKPVILLVVATDEHLRLS